jgi:hypothetical protein
MTELCVARENKWALKKGDENDLGSSSSYLDSMETD